MAAGVFSFAGTQNATDLKVIIFKCLETKQIFHWLVVSCLVMFSQHDAQECIMKQISWGTMLILHGDDTQKSLVLRIYIILIYPEYISKANNALRSLINLSSCHL